MKRVWIAGVVMAALVIGLLGAWFATGWHDVRAEQGRLTNAPVIAASARAGELARSLRETLVQLIDREAARPYFHYQNLFHDPRASAGTSVTPSPLATGPSEPLIAGYFQVDADGAVTLPTINDQFPELSDKTHLAQQAELRASVSQELAPTLRPERAVVAATEMETIVVPAASANPGQVAKGTGSAGTADRATGGANTVFTIDYGAYAQNANPNSVYGQNNPRQPAPANAPGTPKPEEAPPKPQPPAKPIVIKRPKPRQVTISISPLEYRALAFSRGLVATRAVQTPDGNFTQGFIISRTALQHWLADHAQDVTAELHTDHRGAEVLPMLLISTAPNAAELAAATRDANEVATSFVRRFAIAGTVALIAAVLVVMLVARAEHYARERSQFAAAAAHELRTPLAGMQLYGDMLADGLGDPAKLRDYARRMSEEASRLGRVVSNVLGFSQLERGNLSIDARRGELAPALRAIVETAQPALDREGAVVDLSCPDSLEATFDRDALTRIIGNLIDNAEKYSRTAGDRTIQLEALSAGTAIEIRVRDHGTGVTDPAKLFTAFSRGVSSDGPAGLGLGLALSRSLARAMGGELEYRAGTGGATFVLILPA